MTDKICHLCGKHYNDDPFFSHTLKQCLDILKFRHNQASLYLAECERDLAHAEREYRKVEEIKKG